LRSLIQENTGWSPESTRVRNRTIPTGEQKLIEFEFTLDAQMFDEITKLSNELLLKAQWNLFNTTITKGIGVDVNRFNLEDSAWT